MTMPRIERVIRFACIANGVAYFVVGAGLYVKAPWATSLWPWPDVGMSYVFLASIAAAIGAPSIWIGLTGEFAPYFRMLFSGSSAQAGIDDYGGTDGGVNLTSLAVYLTVLSVSTVLALYMAFIHPATRVVAPRRAHRD